MNPLTDHWFYSLFQLAAKSSVVSNIPIVSQYIQTSVPFYQPPVYSYEDLQMIQQRLPHVVSCSSFSLFD